MLVALVVHLRLGLLPDGPLTTRTLLDTDSYTRLLRVWQLWSGGGWYDNTIQRLGAPEGMPLHWTRPLDLLIMAPAALAVVLGAGAGAALWWSAMLVCPVLHALSCLAAVWAARALWPRDVAWAAGVMLLAQPLALSYGAVGRADHHVLIQLLCLLSLGALLRAARDPGARAMAAWAGGFAGLAYWVGPEALLVFMPAMAALGLLYVTDAAGGRGMAAQGLRAALGFAGAILLALAVDVAPGQWLRPESDRVSIVALALGLGLAFVFGGVLVLGQGGWRRRLLAGAGLSALAVAGLALAFPGFYRASLAIDDPLMVQVLGQIREMQPIAFWRAGGIADVLTDLGGALFALAVVPLALARAGRGGEARALVVALLTLAATVAAAIWALRFVVEFAGVAAVGGAGAFVLVARAVRALSAPARGAALVLTALALTVLAPVFGTALQDEAPESAADCPVAPLAAFLQGLRPGPAAADDPIVLTDNINLTPRLAVETAFRFVGGPYHRGIGAMADTAGVFAATDDAAARSLLEKRQVALVVLCSRGPGLRSARPETLGARLEQGRVPGFLSRVELPAELAASYLIFSTPSPSATRR